MSKIYVVGCTLIGLGATLCYIAGREEARQEIKRDQADTWTEASEQKPEPA